MINKWSTKNDMVSVSLGDFLHLVLSCWSNSVDFNAQKITKSNIPIISNSPLSNLPRDQITAYTFWFSRLLVANLELLDRRSINCRVIYQKRKGPQNRRGTKFPSVLPVQLGWCIICDEVQNLLLYSSALEGILIFSCYDGSDPSISYITT